MSKKKVLIVLVIVMITIGIGAFTVINNLFYSMSRLPNGDFLTESTSSDGTYTIKTYLCNGGATTDYAVRGELIINNKNDNPKNIYWDYEVTKANISWVDNDTVIINGHEIDLPNNKYDWRREKN